MLIYKSHIYSFWAFVIPVCNLASMMYEYCIEMGGNTFQNSKPNK